MQPQNSYWRCNSGTHTGLLLNMFGIRQKDKERASGGSVLFHVSAGSCCKELKNGEDGGAARGRAYFLSKEYHENDFQMTWTDNWKLTPTHSHACDYSHGCQSSSSYCFNGFSWSKWAISVTFAAIVVWKHDGEVMWAVSGSVFNTGSSRILKYLFNHQRPLSALSLKTDPGMPSSHAQSIGYLAMYAALSLISWQGFSALTVMGGLAILICGAYLAWLRVSEGLHTYAQVLVGALLGSVAAIAWFSLWKAVVLKAFTSFLWVKITLYVGSVIVCLGFLAFVVRTWRFGEV